MTMDMERLIAALARVGDLLRDLDEPLVLTVPPPLSAAEADELMLLVETLREATGVDVRLNFETQGES